MLGLCLACLCSVLLPWNGVAGSGITVAEVINFHDATVNIDSFSSTNPLYSTNGLYDPTKALDHGDLTTISGNTNSMRLGNAKVRGSIHTGPGGTADIGGQGVVGDNAFVEDASNAGQIQPGHMKHDAIFTLTSAALPDSGGVLWLIPIPGNYVIGGVSYKYLLNASKPWKVSNLDGSIYVTGTDVKLWVTGSINLSGSNEIRIPAGKSLSMYVAATNATIGGNGVVNDTGIAKNFQYFGLPSNTNLTLNGNGAFIGQIYAPQAQFSLANASNTLTGFIGCAVACSATVEGTLNLHFDESAQVFPPFFITHPRSQTVTAGQDVPFFARAESPVPFTYQWRFNGANILGATRTNLMITNVTWFHEGTYSVLASNLYGVQASSNATLVVFSPPIIVSQPASQTVFIGSNATFTAAADGVGPFGYQWFHDGTEIPAATDASLTVSGAQPADSGNYTIVATNSYGATTSSVAVLTLIDPATPFMDNFAARMSFSGANVTVTGALAGATMEAAEPTQNDNGCNYDPVASVWWSWTALESSTVTIIALVDYSTVSTHDRVFEVFFGTDLSNQVEIACNRFEQPANRYLTFAAAAGATYNIRVVGQPFGPFALKLIATNGPVILQQPTGCTVTSYGSASFYVVAAGLPRPTFQWRLNGSALPGQTSPTLLVRNVLTDQAGDYTVTVSNSGGTTESAVATLGLILTAPEPRLTAFPLVSSNQFGFALIGEPGRCYNFEVATNLNPWLQRDPYWNHCVYSWTTTNLLSTPTYNSERQFVRAFMNLDAEACTALLKLVDAAGKLWVIEGRKSRTSIAIDSDLAPYFPGSLFPACPAGGYYNVYEPAVTKPMCSRFGVCCGHGGFPQTCP